MRRTELDSRRRSRRCGGVTHRSDGRRRCGHLDGWGAQRRGPGARRHSGAADRSKRRRGQLGTGRRGMGEARRILRASPFGGVVATGPGTRRGRVDPRWWGAVAPRRERGDRELLGEGALSRVRRVGSLGCSLDEAAATRLPIKATRHASSSMIRIPSLCSREGGRDRLCKLAVARDEARSTPCRDPVWEPRCTRVDPAEPGKVRHSRSPDRPPIRPRRTGRSVRATVRAAPAFCQPRTRCARRDRAGADCAASAAERGRRHARGDVNPGERRRWPPRGGGPRDARGWRGRCIARDTGRRRVLPWIDTLFWILGNHDLGTTASDAQYLHSRINPDLRVEARHRDRRSVDDPADPDAVSQAVTRCASRGVTGAGRRRRRRRRSAPPRPPATRRAAPAGRRSPAGSGPAGRRPRPRSPAGRPAPSPAAA